MNTFLRKQIFFFFLLATSNHVAQQILGVVMDESDFPLEGASVILFPEDKERTVLFASTTKDGIFSFDVEKGKYFLEINYLGFTKYKDTLLVDNSVHKEIKLQPKEDLLKEVIIEYEYQPIKAKRDTIFIDVQAFSDGNERKLKELLNKVPGLEVDKSGIIKLNGKPVKYFLVEDKLFFGGGSKLGVENIPADAVAQIELIDNFTDVDFLKDILNTDELALNVRLKEDRKELWFGEVALGKGNRNFREGNAAIFFYSPKQTLNLIADHNTFGKESLSKEDIFRFLGNKSQFALKNNNINLTNLALFSLSKEKREMVEAQSDLVALNYTREINKNEYNSYLIFNKNNLATFRQKRINYLQENTLERRETEARSNVLSGLGSFQFNNRKHKDKRLKFQTDFNFSLSEQNSFQQSETETDLIFVGQQAEIDFFDLSQFIEYHRSFSKKTKATFVLTSNFNRNEPLSLYESSQPILPNQISLINDETYFIEQIKNITNHEHQARFRVYQILAKNLHLNFDVGNVFQHTLFSSNEMQLLSNNEQNDLTNQGFGNDLSYLLNNSFIGVEVMFRIGKLINKPSVNLHYYYFTNQQASERQIPQKILFEPKWNSQINFSSTHKLSFEYQWNNRFPQPELVANRFQLRDFNLIFRGNELLQEERFHDFKLNLTNFQGKSGYNYFSYLYFNRKTKTIREQVVLEGINQFLTPELRNTPENFYGGGFRLQRASGVVEPFIYPRFSIADYSQLVNNQDIASIRKEQNIEGGIQVRNFKNKELPNLKLSYEKSFQQFRGITSSNFETDKINIDIDYSFLKDFNFTSEFTFFKNRQLDGFTEKFNFLDLNLSYQKSNSPWRFTLINNNVFDVRSISVNQFSDFQTTQTTSFVLPRMLLFRIGYSF